MSTPKKKQDPAKISARKSGGNSGRFGPGADPRRGRGPEKGAPNAGRPDLAKRVRLSNIVRLAMDWQHDMLLARDPSFTPADVHRAIKDFHPKLRTNPVQRHEHSGPDGKPIEQVWTFGGREIRF